MQERASERAWLGERERDAAVSKNGSLSNGCGHRCKMSSILKRTRMGGMKRMKGMKGMKE